MPLVDPVTMAGDSSTAQVSKMALPIEILSTPTARTVTHIHPVILLSAYYVLFPHLVADPVSTLFITLPALAIAQIAYVACSLPVAKGNKASKKSQKTKPGVAKKASESHSLPILVSHNHNLQSHRSFAKTSQDIIVSLAASLLSVPALTVLQVFFGAPLTTHLLHTTLTSAHIALLAVFPLLYVHGFSTPKWIEIISAQCPADEVFGGAVGAFVGAWLGAIPIPLDWDREWQKWPVTIISGAYAGYVAGKILGGYVFKGKKVDLD